MRHDPFICQICDQVEQPIYDEETGEEHYSDEDLCDHDLHWYAYRWEFPICAIQIMVCEECSKMGDEVFDRYRERIRCGEIRRFH